MDCITLTSKNGLLLDFDGTICFLFKNFNLHNTVDELCECMHGLHISYSNTQDAFDVFDEIIRQTTNNIPLRNKALTEANRIIVDAEIKAIHTCEPIRGAIEVLKFFVESGLSLGISTNNSAVCVKAFFDKHLPGIVIPVAGRIAECPHLMKPNTWTIEEVCGELGVQPKEAIYIGDTQRDYVAAKNAGCLFWGMGATERKKARLSNILSDDNIVNDFFDLKDKMVASKMFTTLL